MTSFRNAFLTGLLFFLVACSFPATNRPSEVSVSGTYSSNFNSENYVWLLLREDSTYQFKWQPLQSDAVFRAYGAWYVQGQTVVLSKGRDITDFLAIVEQSGTDDDTLTVCLGERMQGKFSIKLSNDSLDFFDPSDTCMLLKKELYLDPNLDGQFETFGDYPIALEGRYKEFYFGIPNAFRYRRIRISLRDSINLDPFNNLDFMKLEIIDNGLIPLPNEEVMDTLYFNFKASIDSKPEEIGNKLK